MSEVLGEMAFGISENEMIQIERVSDRWVNRRQGAHFPETFAVADPISI